MTKIGTRSYTLEIEDKYNKKSVAIEPPTQIQFNINMAVYTKLSVGYIKIYNPDSYLKDLLMYKYPLGDERNKLYINFKPILLGTTSTGQVAYNYSSSTKAFVYQTTLVHPNPKEEYIHLQLLSGLYDLFGRTYNTAANSTTKSALSGLERELSRLGYPLSYSLSADVAPLPFSSKNTPMGMLNRILEKEDRGAQAYLEDLVLGIMDPDFKKGKGSRGSIGSYNNPFEVDPENGLMSFPQQVNNDLQFQFILDHKFPLDSYVRISRDLINRQLVTPSVGAGSGGLNWLLGKDDIYRVLGYTLVGDYFDPATWYQEVVVQSGNMPLAANLTYTETIGAL